MLLHLRAMLLHLRAMLLHLRAMLLHLRAMLLHLWAILLHLRAMLLHLWAMLLSCIILYLTQYILHRQFPLTPLKFCLFSHRNKRRLKPQPLCQSFVLNLSATAVCKFPSIKTSVILALTRRNV
jgi:hypothetical protein